MILIIQLLTEGGFEFLGFINEVAVAIVTRIANAFLV